MPPMQDLSERNLNVPSPRRGFKSAAITAGIVVGQVVTVGYPFLNATTYGALAQGNDKHSTTEEENSAITRTKKYLSARQYGRAITGLNQAIDKAPLSAPLHLWRGNVFWAFCDYKNAARDFDTAINQNDSLADAYANKAACLARVGLTDQAIALFKIAAKKNTSDPSIALFISRALFECKDYQGSLDYLKSFDKNISETSNKDPNENASTDPNKNSDLKPNLQLTRAQDEAALGQLDLAATDMSELIAASPAFYLAYLARARVYQKQSQYEKALTDAFKAIELNKKRFPTAHLIAGECLLSLNRLPQADQEIILAIQESGHVPSGEAQHYKALITERKGNFFGSLPDRAVALQLGYLDPPPLTILGREILSPDNVFTRFNAVVPGEHFICYSDLPREKLERYSRLVEGFANYVNADVCSLQGEYPALLFILHDKASEQGFLRECMDFNRGVHGVFISGRNSVVTYEGAGLGTLLHEVMHKFLYNVKAHDFWADEGVPCFFEKSYGYLFKDSPDAQQNLFLKTGYVEASSHLWMWLTKSAVKLSQIVTSARYADPNNEDAQRLVALFLNHEHKLKPFLDLTFKGTPGKYKYFIEAIFDKNLENLDPLFDAYLAEINKNHDLIMKLPATEIFDTKEQFDRFAKDNKLDF